MLVGDSPYSGAKDAKRTKAVGVSASSSSSSSDTDSTSDTVVIKSYQARRSSRRGALVAEKRKAEEDVIVVEQGAPSKKKTKQSPARRPPRPVDPGVVEFIRQTKFPLDVVARHGASIGSQAKRAIKQIWDEERVSKRKKKTAAKAISHMPSSSLGG